MTREEFSANLHKATLQSHTKALVFVENELKPPFSFFVKLNQSYDGNPLAEGEVIPRVICDKGEISVGALPHDEAVALLWLDGLVPEWIDIIPWEASSDGLKFQLLCCGRFTNTQTHLYHIREGYPPFHAPGVWSPPRWESLEKNGRFDVNWHLKRQT